MENNFTAPNGNEIALDKATSVGSALLGRYNDKDEYVLAPAIIDELLAVEKFKKTTFKNSVFCTCFLPVYGELTFEVVYEKNTTNHTALATIYLLENEVKVNGYVQNTIKTKIGDFIGELDGFIEESYKKFNISIMPLGEGKEYNVVEDEKLEGYIVAKQQFNSLLGRISAEECSKIYQDYFTKRLELLNQLNNPFSKAILEKFKIEYAKIEKYFLRDKDYKALSELLDKCIEDVSGVNLAFKDNEKEFREKVLPVILLFVEQMEKANEKAANKAKTMLRKKDQSKIESIEKQEMTAKPTQSNAGKSKPSLAGVVKGDNPKVMAARGSGSKSKQSPDILQRLGKLAKEVKDINHENTKEIPVVTKKQENQKALNDIKQYIKDESKNEKEVKEEISIVIKANTNITSEKTKEINIKDFTSENKSVLNENKINDTTGKQGKVDIIKDIKGSDFELL